MKKLITILLFLALPLWICAQATSGSIGLLNIPNAEMQADGTFLFGANYLPEEMTPEVFSYNTGNYYLNMTFLPFLEVSYRMILFKMENSGKYTNQDRSIAVRLQLLKEKKNVPAIVIGGNDIFSSGDDIITEDDFEGNDFFRSYYGVITKNFDWKANKIGSTIGYGFHTSKSSSNTQINRVFGGLSVTPFFCKELSFIAEYDSKNVNVGASVLLFKHLYLHSFLYDCKYLVGGFAYKIYLKH